MVLDTHALLWLGENPERLSQAARETIAQAERHGEKLIVSTSSLYEIAWAVSRGRIFSEIPLHELLLRIERRFTMVSLTTEIAIAAAQIPATFPSDPFDRIIAATAIVEGVPLITADQRIRSSHALRTIW